MRLIERTLYLDKLKRVRNTPDIKIITGIRRSGKSELMRAYLKYIKETEPQINVIELEYGDLEYDNLKNYKNLYAYVEENYKPHVKNVLMIDEVQLCPQFEIAINSLHNSKKYNIYVTGSNAFY